jgi:hypothetical protein
MMGLKESDRAAMARIELHDGDLITVCNCCLRACCWHGELMCDYAQGAGTVEKTVADLRASPHGESEDYWKWHLCVANRSEGQ